jgi:hypothetical protein
MATKKKTRPRMTKAMTEACSHMRMMRDKKRNTAAGGVYWWVVAPVIIRMSFMTCAMMLVSYQSFSRSTLRI